MASSDPPIPDDVDGEVSHVPKVYRYEELFKGFQNLTFPTLPPINPPSLPEPFLTTFDPDEPVGPAAIMCDRIEKAIENRKSTMMEGYELDVEYHTPTGETIYVEDFGYHNPNLLYIYGHDCNGNPVNVLAPSNSPHLLLRSVPMIKEQVRRPIGFLGNMDVVVAEVAIEE